MTNEEVVDNIQRGIDTKDNMLLLWGMNKGIVYRIARKYSAYEETEDLTQQGYIGLYNAANCYNRGVGVPFVNYCAIWIRQSIQRYVDECSGVIHVPRGLNGLATKYKRLTAFTLANYGRKPTENETMQYLNISSARFEKLQAALIARDVKSLNTHISDEGEETELLELVQSDTDVEGEVLDKVEHEGLQSLLWGMVDRLPQEQAQVIRNKYIDNMTLKEISAATGRKESEVRTAETNALKTLSHCKGSTALNEYAYNMGLKGCGVAKFKRTWTSSTERAALEMQRTLARDEEMLD